VSKELSEKLYELAERYDEKAREARRGGGADPPLTHSQALDLIADVLRELWLAL
jgi:hypothetical protein